MTTKIFIPCALLAIGIASVGFADFPGPAPVAWRWVQPTSVSPGGVPQVEGNRVYVASGGWMYALELATGNQIWRFPRAEPLEGNFRSGVVLHENRVIGAADNRNVYAVDVETGELIWQYLAPQPVAGIPVIAGNSLVFAQTDGSLMAVNLETGLPTWSEPVRPVDGVLGQIAAYQSNVIFFTSGGLLRSLNIATQRATWEQRLGTVTGLSVPVVSEGTLYVNTGTFVAALNAASGAGRWQFNTQQPLIFGPAVSSRGVMVISAEGRAILLDRNGRPLLSQPVDLRTPPAVVPTSTPTNYIVPLINGDIRLVDSENGSILWNFVIPPLTTARPGEATGGGGGGVGAGAGAGAGGLGSGGAPDAGASGTRAPQRVQNPPASGSAVVAGSTMLVMVSDGSLIAFSRESGVDRTPPRVQLLWPLPGSEVSTQPGAELIFRVQDEASGVNVNTLEIKVGDRALKYEIDRDGFVVIRMGPDNPQLQNGRQIITLTVADWMGNRTEREFVLFVDNTLPVRARPR
jgi:outer membrane protein assembly factor BamB